MSGSLLDTIPETIERRKSGELSFSRYRSGVDLVSGHHRLEREKSGHFVMKTGAVRKLFPRRSVITTIPEDLQLQSSTDETG